MLVVSKSIKEIVGMAAVRWYGNILQKKEVALWKHWILK